jgi:hypothetical protein
MKVLEFLSDAWPTPEKRAAQRARARELGQSRPPYVMIEDEVAARAELDRQVALCEATLRASDLAAAATNVIPWEPLPTGPFAPANPCQLTLAKPARGAPLPPTEAAIRFRDWLIDNGHTGAHGSAKLSALYATYCREANVLKTPENRLRRELKQVPGGGVTKLQADKRHRGKGPRPILWEISPVQRRAA